jgi:DNA-binding IclR family transcriptional regulator
MVYSSLSLRRIAAPHLRLLRDRLNEPAFLAILYHDELLFIDKKENRANPISFGSIIGARRPPHFGVFGQVLMAYLPDNEIERIMQRSPLVAFTKKTVATSHEFREVLRKVRQQGFAAEEETAIEGFGGIAAPVRDFSGRVVGALGVVFISSLVKKKKLDRMIGVVLATAQDVSRDQGYVVGEENMDRSR